MVIEFDDIKDLYPFSPNYVSIRDYRYHYIDEGEGDPVVMLHGNPTWSFMFRNLVPELSRTHRVIVPDHLGCGLSDKPSDFPYRLETHIDNLERLLLGMELKNITLLMHDWGGAIGMGFAVRHPERMKRFVITNSAAFSMPRIPWRIAVCRTPWLGRKMIVDWNWFCRAAIKMTVSKPMDKKVAEGYLFPYQNPEDREAIYRFVRDIPMSGEDASYEVLLAIEYGLWMFRDKPVDILWGMKDWCFNLSFLERWRKCFPRADVLKLQDAGHNLFEDAAAEISGFLKDKA